MPPLVGWLRIEPVLRHIGQSVITDMLGKSHVPLSWCAEWGVWYDEPDTRRTRTAVKAITCVSLSPMRSYAPRTFSLHYARSVLIHDPSRLTGLERWRFFIPMWCRDSWLSDYFCTGPSSLFADSLSSRIGLSTLLTDSGAICHF